MWWKILVLAAPLVNALQQQQQRGQEQHPLLQQLPHPKASHQDASKLDTSESQQGGATADAFPNVQEYAMDQLSKMSNEGILIFESVMKQMRDSGNELVNKLTWDYPAPRPIPRRTDWDAYQTLAQFPDYTLRVKSVNPEKLHVDTVKQYSGYLDVDEDKHFFYWFFESRNDPKNDPVVLWLNGGPGCSSLTGLFFELGPASVNKDGTNTTRNPYSWNNNASVIFLDQPINVGYSYGSGSVSNTVAAGKDVFALLSLFFKQFPQYAHQDFHIAGESYAGHYIPQFAKEIIEHQTGKRNDFLATGTDMSSLPKINLKSVLIGNGLTDPLVQYDYYAQMACNNSYGPVLDEEKCAQMDASYPRCASLIQSCYDNQNVFSCVPASLYCNSAMIGPVSQAGVNVYDVREPCEDQENLCYPQLGYIQTYLNRDDVKEAVGAEVEDYESCNMQVNQNFLFNGDWMKPYHLAVPTLLENDVAVLIYAGTADFICNAFGNEAWTLALEWPGKKKFNAAKVNKFKADGQHAGDSRNYGNFTFLTIFDAGHMVPFNQPKASLEFFNRWVLDSDYALA